METLRRWREPAVIVVLLVLGVRLLLVVAAALVPELVGVESPVDAAYLVSSQLGDSVLFVLLAALVAACHGRPVTPHARRLALAALLLTGAVLLVVLVLAVLGYASFPSPLRRIELASRMLGLVLPAMAVVALGLLVGRSRSTQPALSAGPATQSDGDDRDVAPPAVAAPSDPQLEPTWQPDIAAGAAWLSAGDAASGRPASGWGAADQAAGWQPAVEPSRPQSGAAGPGPVEQPGHPEDSPPAGSSPAAEAQPPHPWSQPRP